MLHYLRPDGKTQVTVEYDEAGKPKRIDTVVVSTQHAPRRSWRPSARDMIELVIKPIIPAGLLDGETKILCQPDRPLRHRRPAGRQRSDRAARSSSIPTAASAPHGGGCLLRQGPDEGGPLRRLRRAL